MRLARLEALLLVIGVLCGCVNNVPRITSEEEKRIKEQLEAESKQWQEKQQAKVEEVASRILEATGTQSIVRFVFVAKLDQTGSKIHPDIVNAWTDGTTVWITRGMFRFLKNDDELAAVLAHELGHALRGHMREGIAQGILGTAVTIPAGIFGGQIGSQLAARMVQLINAKFDRDRERDADLHGLLWAYRAGFNVDQGKEVFKRMAIEMPESTNRGWLSTHPASPERFWALDKIAAALKAGQDPLIVFGPKGENLKSEEKTKEEDQAKSAETGKTEEKPAGAVRADDEEY